MDQRPKKVRAKTVKLLEENIEEKLHEVGFSYDLLGNNTKSPGNKEKIDKWDFIKVKNFCALKSVYLQVIYPISN